MQVQAIENWAELLGIIREIEHHSHLPEWWTIRLEVQEVRPVANFPNLFASDLSSIVSLIVPAKTVQDLGLAAGKRIMCRVRKAGPGVSFAQPESIAFA
ncbi:MAG TPA: hypothetical protein VKB49_27755 [Candidatus Sulfotelmatobacter sp.]|nr:hypothetical protein [Candidatus Sulfotelmatobacter sp.]